MPIDCCVLRPTANRDWSAPVPIFAAPPITAGLRRKEAGMALFGSRGDRSAEAAELEAEIERLDQLLLPALAAEVMAKAFGPGAEWEDPEEEVMVGGSTARAGATVPEITTALAPEGSIKGADERIWRRLQRLVAEAVQALEHAALIRPQSHNAMEGLDYTPTRFGRTVLAAGAVAEVVGGEPAA
jgi:hypothetical protein